MRKRFLRLFSKFFSAYWPIGLFGYYAIVALSLGKMPQSHLLQLFGVVLVLCGAVIWMVNDYVRDSDNRVQEKLEEISDLLAPYDGMKLSEMPQEVQDEVRRRLGWTMPLKKNDSAENEKP